MHEVVRAKGTKFQNPLAPYSRADPGWDRSYSVGLTGDDAALNFELQFSDLHISHRSSEGARLAVSGISQVFSLFLFRLDSREMFPCRAVFFPPRVRRAFNSQVVLNSACVKNFRRRDG